MTDTRPTTPATEPPGIDPATGMRYQPGADPIEARPTTPATEADDDFEEMLAGFDRIIHDKALQQQLLDAGLLVRIELEAASPAALDIEAVRQTMLNIGMIQREPKDTPAPPWPTVSPFSWAEAFVREYARLSPSSADVTGLVSRHTHDGGNVLIYNLRNTESGCLLCRALVAAGVLTLDEIGADTRARLSQSAGEQGGTGG